VNPDNGAVTEDVSLTLASSGISLAFSNNFTGASTTNLYVLDVDINKLYRRSSPTASTLEEVGNLGTDPVRVASFDIGGMTNTAYAFFFDANSTTRFYRIDLATGAATQIGGNFGFTGYYSNGLAIGLGF
jgi:hypothetical protein